MQVSAGKVVTLLGGNGAGKTTTLKTISGILVPKSGLISFEGLKINGLSTERIVKLGLAHIAQDRELFNKMTVLENLELGATVRKNSIEIRRDLQKVFEYFPILQERSSQKAATLSGGEQRMLAIGRGLMSSPKLLMMDEPSAGLAPILVAQMAKLISGLNADGLTILLVEQNVRMALSISSSSYVIRGGEIVYSGDSRMLFDEEIYRSYFG
jgi:branched-chain amino acid transport system ATP-binding protein